MSFPIRLAAQLIAMSHEGEHLHTEIVQLRHENLELHETLRAFQRIEKLSSFRAPVGYRSVPTAVVAYEPTNFVNGCMVDRGAEEHPAGHRSEY